VKATEVTAGRAESNGSLRPGLWRDSLYVTCGLTACTPGSAQRSVTSMGKLYLLLLPSVAYNPDELRKMYRSQNCPSVCRSQHGRTATAANSRLYRSIIAPPAVSSSRASSSDVRRPAAGSATLSAYVAAEHRLHTLCFVAGTNSVLIR